MAYWLVKSEPGTWSWADQVKASRTNWSGVRNHQAAANLRAMKTGDRCFFYHSGEDKSVVGVVEVVRTHYPDPEDETGKFVAVDVKAVMPLKTPVSLAQIKAEPKLKDLLLVRHSRLSVSPVDAPAWARICQMGGVKP